MKRKIGFLSAALIICVTAVIAVHAFSAREIETEIEFNPTTLPPALSVDEITEVKSNGVISEKLMPESFYKSEILMEADFNTEGSDFIYTIFIDGGDPDPYGEQFRQFIAPCGIQVDGSKNIYILNPGEMTVIILNPQGEVMDKISYEEFPLGEQHVAGWGVNYDGDVYLLTPYSLYRKKNGQNEFERIVSGFESAHELHLLKSGKYIVLDFAPDHNLRAGKYSEEDKLLSEIKQWSYRFNLFEFEDEAGSILKLDTFGGDSSSQLQYTIQHERYEKPFLISVDTWEKDAIYGFRIQDIYDKGICFLKELHIYNGIPGERKTFYYLENFTYENAEFSCYEVDIESVTGKVFGNVCLDDEGNVYILNTTEEKIWITKLTKTLEKIDK